MRWVVWGDGTDGVGAIVYEISWVRCGRGKVVGEIKIGTDGSVERELYYTSIIPPDELNDKGKMMP